MNRARPMVACALALCAGVATAQEAPGSWRVETPAPMAPGEVSTFSIVFDVNPGWQLYASSPANSAAGVTSLAITTRAPDGIDISRPVYPRADRKGRYVVYNSGQIDIEFKLRPEPGIESGTYAMDGDIQYQFCRADLCLPPRRESYSVAFDVR